MSEQALDLRRSARIVRRHWILVVVFVILGAAGGGAFAVLRPPMVSSEALVVLPKAAPSIATEALIAASDPVLAGALPHVSPHMSLQKLQTLVKAKSVTPFILSITAKGTTATQAETTANAVAHSYIAYVGSANTQVGHVKAAILQPASTATATSFLKRLIIDALVGAAAGALIAIILALVFNRADRRLAKRDEIASSVGIPVLAAVPAAHPTDATGWTRLLGEYEPGAVHGLRLRQALQQLGMTTGDLGGGIMGDRSSLTVLSLTSDPGALALGPQLAVFIASMGIPTALIIGPQQDISATAALRTACAVPPPASSKRPAFLRVAVQDNSDSDERPTAGLTIVVASVDSQNPQVTAMIRTSVTVLGVSAGAATAEQLASTVSAAVSDSRDVAGVLVANPDPTDHTTGHVSPPSPGAHRRTNRPAQRIATETKR